KGMDEDAVVAVLLRHLQQCVKMRLLRVHAPIRNQTEQMQSALTYPGVLHRAYQHGMREELAVLDHQIDARDVHVNDAAGADVEMPDLAVSHLSFRQADERPAGMNQRIGIFAEKPVIRRLARQRDGVGLGLGTVSPTVEDDEDERIRAGHWWKSSC